MSSLWFSLAVLSLLAVSVDSHSWLDCVKDVGTGLRTGYAECKGFPRNYPGRVPGVNIDQIMTYRIQPSVMGQNPPICSAGQQTPNYKPEYPMAQANAGETLRMRWTPNGHQTGAGQTPLTYVIHWTGKAGTQLKNRLDLNDTNRLAGPFAFDETCFCNNCAGDPCYGKFTIPSNTPSGTYAFIWYWVFNRDAGSGGEEYTTCFDVAVTATNTPVSTPRTSASRTSAARTSAARTSAVTPTPTQNAVTNVDTNADTTETSVDVPVTTNTYPLIADVRSTGTSIIFVGLIAMLAVTLLL